MSVLALVVILILLAVAAYFVHLKVPAGAIKTIINVVLIVVAVVLCLAAFGVWDEVKSIQVPKL